MCVCVCEWACNHMFIILTETKGKTDELAELGTQTDMREQKKKKINSDTDQKSNINFKIRMRTTIIYKIVLKLTLHYGMSERCACDKRSVVIGIVAVVVG